MVRSALLLSAAALPTASHAEVIAGAFDIDQRSTFGDLGLLEMPSAHMAPDGQLAFTVAAINGAQRYNVGFQLLPWLEGTFRYSHININHASNFYDRSFGVKIRLSRETEDWPEISLGARDLAGTGVYSTEYLVGTKSIYDLDLTLGIGWGRLAEDSFLNNPLAQIIPSFANRPPSAEIIQNAGAFRFDQLFHGKKIGLIAGSVWHTPIDGLSAIVEYSPDHYEQEVAGHDFTYRMPVNVGFSYKITDLMSVSAGWLYGTSYDVTLTTSFDPTTDVAPVHIGPAAPAVVLRPEEQQVAALNTLFTDSRRFNVSAERQDPFVQSASEILLSEASAVRATFAVRRTLVVETSGPMSTAKEQCRHYATLLSKVQSEGYDTIAVSDLQSETGEVQLCPLATAVSDQTTRSPDSAASPRLEDKIRADLRAQAIDGLGFELDHSSIWLYYQNYRYNVEDEAVGRILRVLMADAPPSVEIFNLVSVQRGLALRQFRFARSELERAAAQSANRLEDLERDTMLPPLSNPILDASADYAYPRFHWAIGPGFEQTFFDPDRPLQIKVSAVASGSIEVVPGLELQGRYEANVYNNFSFDQLSNSLLPHVRTDEVLYEKFGANGIARLAGRYRVRIARDVMAEVDAGYLESMFAGAGGQVLWRPEGSRFAVGADAYEVWQRNFDRLFGLQSYHVLTGHVTAYYQSPWYGLNFNVHVGRYLAGDWGTTVEVTRRFETGVEIGAFATVTNVSATRFGEGRFDKGIIVHIPFEWPLPISSQSAYDFLLRPVQRDGGARLDDDDSLYSDSVRTSYAEVIGHGEDVINP